MASEIVQGSRDLLSSARTSALAWWIPKAAIVVALFIPPPARTGIWIIALVWMGTACILNSRRCGRTHCRYTGPYYLAMIAPVLVVASGVISVDFYPWLSLAVLILGGGPRKEHGENSRGTTKAFELTRICSHCRPMLRHTVAAGVPFGRPYNVRFLSAHRSR